MSYQQKVDERNDEWILGTGGGLGNTPGGVCGVTGMLRGFGPGAGIFHLFFAGIPERHLTRRTLLFTQPCSFACIYCHACSLHSPAAPRGRLT